ncbi:MAG: DUF1905 domain-containing protein [Candidatus Magasanikbacteria bacterium CG10_big_fil_rev_8_21_14_0_10_43_6]|uniref:DUF1905 domain-containing protein n=1 Tax=Candidatus Magasanikbacteria bacterium CG10_big_fil_rev_8_21_14_0_10_43_6 TaxID=1974650 RepID=A0A2M6W1U1_9BACT|nr:MAG: DUF1905 domain-containing protein [Candidatus Magasanikbacteria bacterium CG10_big_fil_rev_8_21_14_0_10_43_6]
MKTCLYPTTLWRYQAENAAWFFLTIDPKESEKIKASNTKKKQGGGQIKVKVTIGKTTWHTSLFPGKGGVYLLPVKVAVRRAENIQEGDVVSFSCRF